MICLWFGLSIGAMALTGWGLHRYIEHREFVGQEQGLTLGKAIGRLSDEELFEIIHGCPMPPPPPILGEPALRRKRRWRR